MLFVFTATNLIAKNINKEQKKVTEDVWIIARHFTPSMYVRKHITVKLDDKDKEGNEEQKEPESMDIDENDSQDEPGISIDETKDQLRFEA
jgi:hypothetical protein